MDLLVLTSLLRTEKTAAAFTSFPVSLVGAVLRRSSAMLAIPLKRAFYLEKRGGEDSDGRSGGGKKKTEKSEKRAEKEKGREEGKKKKRRRRGKRWRTNVDDNECGELKRHKETF